MGLGFRYEFSIFAANPANLFGCIVPGNHQEVGANSNHLTGLAIAFNSLFDAKHLHHPWLGARALSAWISAHVFFGAPGTNGTTVGLCFLSLRFASLIQFFHVFSQSSFTPRAAGAPQK